jgi:hypothetical protein
MLESGTVRAYAGRILHYYWRTGANTRIIEGTFVYTRRSGRVFNPIASFSGIWKSRVQIWLRKVDILPAYSGPSGLCRSVQG